MGLAKHPVLAALALFFFAGPLQAEQVNEDFICLAELLDAAAVRIRVNPLPDRNVTGVAADKPFVVLGAEGFAFENNGRVFQTGYLTAEEPGEFLIGFSPDSSGLALTLSFYYTACSQSRGICDPPRKSELTLTVERPVGEFSWALLDTLILAGCFAAGTVGVVVFLRQRKTLFFTAGLFFILGGAVFYSFRVPVLHGLSQADYSHQVASTLCLSCIGLEVSNTAVAVDREKTRILADLARPAHITVFAAPWCGSCPAAERYVAELCALYPNTLTFEIADVSTPAGAALQEQQTPVFGLAKLLPLPALTVSTNTKRVIYGTTGLEDALLAALLEGNDG